MVVWAVVSAEIEQAIELFPKRAEIEKMGRRVLEDEPDWRDELWIERLELDSESRRTSEPCSAGDLFAGRRPRHAPEGRRTPEA
jgi:hypothetical protein